MNNLIKMQFVLWARYLEIDEFCHGHICPCTDRLENTWRTPIIPKCPRQGGFLIPRLLALHCRCFIILHCFAANQLAGRSKPSGG